MCLPVIIFYLIYNFPRCFIFVISGNASSFTLTVADFPPGDYNFTIDAVDVFGQAATVVVELFLAGKLIWYNNIIAEIRCTILAFN